MKNIIIGFFSFVFVTNLIGQNDTTKNYYGSGQLRSIYYNVGNKIHSKVFYISGNLRGAAILSKDSSIIEGTLYNENGEITSISTKKKSIVYDRKSNRVIESKLKNEVFHGESTVKENDKLIYKIFYKKGTPVKAQIFDENGDIKSEILDFAQISALFPSRKN